MPIYEYQCQKCDYLFEKLQKITDKPVALCPECSSKAKKIMSSSSFILKGAGFYVNDYTRESKKDNKKVR